MSMSRRGWVGILLTLQLGSSEGCGQLHSHQMDGPTSHVPGQKGAQPAGWLGSHRPLRTVTEWIERGQLCHTV